MSRRRCCCGTGTGTAGCVVFSDSFDRTNNSDVGSDWLESTGTGGPFQIVSNKLSITGGAGETLECLHTIPSDVGTGTAAPDHYLVYVSVGFDTDRDIAQVMVDDQAVYVELERYDEHHGQLRIFETVDGTTTCFGSRNVPLYPSNNITVCVDGDLVHASMGAAELLTIPHTTVSSVVHLSAVSAGTVTFDDFVLSEHYYDDPACPDCRNEDCEWFFDSGFESGELSDADYVHTLGTGTGTAEGGWDYYNNALRATQDARIQVAVSSPRGITGAVNFSVDLSNANVGCYIDMSYDGGSCFVRITKDESHISATWFCGSDQLGIENTLTTPSVRICWDGTQLTGDTPEAAYHFVESPTAFCPTAEVGGLTSGYALINQVSATKTGDLLDPARECDECDDQDCGCVPFYNTATLTLSGISLRDPWPTGAPALPYGSECPESAVFHLTARSPSSSSVGCMWTGYTDRVFPHYCATGSWSLARLYAEVRVSTSGGGKLFSVTLGTVDDSSSPTPGQTVPNCLWGAHLIMYFAETLVGDEISCDSILDLAPTGCNQEDDMRLYWIYGSPSFLACQFCTCVTQTSPCTDLTTPLTLDFASPDPDV